MGGSYFEVESNVFGSRVGGATAATQWLHYSKAIVIALKRASTLIRMASPYEGLL
jgi:hypothetical protein